MTDLMERLERVVDAVADEIINKAEMLDIALGERPFAEKTLPERAQVRRYSLIRDDEIAWKGLIDQFGQKPVVEYVKRMERMRMRYPEEELPEPPQVAPPEMMEVFDNAASPAQNA